MSYAPDQLLLGPLDVLDNQPSAVSLFSYSAPANLYVDIEYSLLKDGSYRTGTLSITTDGTSMTSGTDEFVETGASGVVFSASFSAGSVNVLYTSTSTGSAGIFKYSIRSWS